MAEQANISLYTLPLGMDANQHVVEQLLWRHQHDLTQLSKGVIYLPTRRSVTSLRDMFMQIGMLQGKNFLLPRLVAIGDVGMDMLEQGFASFDEIQADDLSDAVNSYQRILLLAQMIKKSRFFDGAHGQALKMAQSLAQLLDQLHIAGKDIADLDHLTIDEEYASHWQNNARFLKDILRQAWQAKLAELELMDVVAYHHQMLRTEIDKITDNHDDWFLALGSTGSRHSTAELLHHIMQHPRGEVIVPALINLSAEACQEILQDASHPQYVLYHNLHHVWHIKQKIAYWQCDDDTTSSLNHAYLLQMMRPKNMLLDTALQNEMTDYQPQAWELVTASSSYQEALMIMLMMREGIESHESTLLVTADNDLARLVAKLLYQHYGIYVDMTQGLPLKDSTAGRYLLLLLEAWRDNFTNVKYFVPLAQHPFSCFGMRRADALEKLRRVQYQFRTSTNSDTDGASLSELLQQDFNFKAEKIHQDSLFTLRVWLEKFMALIKLQSHSPTPDDADADADLDSDSNMRDDVDMQNSRAFRHEDGIACFSLLDKLSLYADDVMLNAEDFQQLLEFFLTQEIYRPQRDYHPKLTILGTFESRLQHAERVIIGGMREGMMPRKISADLWFNRNMRQQLALPPAELNIGQAAHDFIQLLAGKKVFLTLPQKVDGQLVLESRFITRLKMAFPAWAQQQADQQKWQDWAQTLYASTNFVPNITPPNIKKSAIMPNHIAVTRVPDLQQNPYGFYARNILKLKPLPQLFGSQTQTQWGNLVHKILDADMRAMNQDALNARMDKILAQYYDSNIRRELLKIRLQPILHFMLITLAQGEIVKNHAEIFGKATLTTRLGNRFELRGKADAIQQDRQGNYYIVDYKTGTVPRKKDITSLLAPQLPLLAYMLLANGFEIETHHDTDIEDFAYWQLKPRASECKTTSFTKMKEIESLVELMDEYASDLCQRWDGFASGAVAFASVPDPSIAPKYNDYEHLARNKEWQNYVSKGGADE